jgi:hypothetical protein
MRPCRRHASPPPSSGVRRLARVLLGTTEKIGVTSNSVASVAAMIMGAAAWSSAGQQRPSGPAVKPKVDVVTAIGCVEHRTTAGGQWWLTRAAEPTVSREGVFTTTDIETAKKAPQGTGAFRLIGEAEYLDAEGLLKTQRRAEFTTREQVNASGALREGRTVLVKGLLIADGEARINLLQVAPLADTCS